MLFLRKIMHRLNLTIHIRSSIINIKQTIRQFFLNTLNEYLTINVRVTLKG